MKSRAQIAHLSQLKSLLPLLAVALLFPACAYIKHVPPGQSLSEVLALKPQLVAYPTPTPPPPGSPLASAPVASQPSTIETEKVADAFTLGNLCLQQGRYPDAIAAYQTALKADPTFAEAWNNLAIAYQNTGQDEKAMAAFRKYKMVALH
jgi:tetratricopeptide (TPR) repeat protein